MVGAVESVEGGGGSKSKSSCSTFSISGAC